MKAIVAYSFPRGPYGRCIFTVVLEYNLAFDEHSDIKMFRPEQRQQEAYRCSSCGRWATITTVRTVNVSMSPSEHRDSGKLEFYRFDNVEPGDYMVITMQDSDLMFAQQTDVRTQGSLNLRTTCYPIRQNPHLNTTIDYPRQLYDAHLINWDEYLRQNPMNGRSVKIEEELINQTMNAQPISITQLLLEPPKQPMLEDKQFFIEGELRYL